MAVDATQPVAVQLVPLARLRPAPWNPRTIREPRFKNLCQSIQADPDFLWRRPVLALADGTVYAGNMRLRAAQHLGWKSVPAIVEDVPEQLAKERALRDNRGWGDDDDQALAELLYELQEMGTPLDLLGFEDGEVAALLASVSGPEPAPDPGADLDRAEELRERWQTAPGQLWEIPSLTVPGRCHRLLCGDSTSADDVARLMGGERAAAVVTDPPYGINRDGITNDSPEGLLVLFQGALEQLPIDNAVVAAFQSPRLFWVWLDALRAAGHTFERLLWMYKPNDETFPWRGWLLTSEAILLSSVGKGQWQNVHPYSHDVYSPTTLGSELEEGQGWHASVKPLAVVRDVVQRISPAGALLYEPFTGSGTTIVAAEQTGRACYGLEIEPKYVAVALERLAGMGLTPRQTTSIPR